MIYHFFINGYKIIKTRFQFQGGDTQYHFLYYECLGHSFHCDVVTNAVQKTTMGMTECVETGN